MYLPYVVGTVLSLGVAVFARRVGLDRDRAFYPTLVIVVASYYVLFAAVSGSVSTVLMESIVMTGFWQSPWSVSSRVHGSSWWRSPAMESLTRFTAG